MLRLPFLITVLWVGTTTTAPTLLMADCCFRSGVIRGCGRQLLAAQCNLGAFLHSRPHPYSSCYFRRQTLCSTQCWVADRTCEDRSHAYAVNYWFIGVPVAVVLAFHYHLGVAGLWTGLLVATSIQGEQHTYSLAPSIHTRPSYHPGHVAKGHAASLSKQTHPLSSYRRHELCFDCRPPARRSNVLLWSLTMYGCCFLQGPY